MMRIDINPATAEGYLLRAQRRLERLDPAAAGSAQMAGERLLEGLFSLVADDIPASREEQVDLAASEWMEAGGEISPHLLARIKKAILNLGLARVFAGVGTSSSPHVRTPAHAAGRDRAEAAA